MCSVKKIIKSLWIAAHIYIYTCTTVSADVLNVGYYAVNNLEKKTPKSPSGLGGH